MLHKPLHTPPKWPEARRADESADEYQARLQVEVQAYHAACRAQPSVAAEPVIDWSKVQPVEHNTLWRTLPADQLGRGLSRREVC